MSEPAVRRRRHLRLVFLLALFGACAAEQGFFPPARQPSARAVVALIDLYRGHGSALLRDSTGVRCRFTPTCSRYARAAVLRYGSVVGGLRSGWRLARCGPWTPAGTSDEVPGEDPSAE